jgi:glycosidase
MIWMMGVWKLGSYSLARATDAGMRSGSYGPNLPDYTFDDIIGSPYAPVDYVVNPELGTDDDLAILKQKLNSMGLKLMLDFVPNHSAVDAPWVSSNPDLYINVAKGTPLPYDPSSYLPNGVANGRDPYFAAWGDTAQWNYWNPATRQLQLQKLTKVASLADAIRCDMAMLLLNDIIQQIWSNQLSTNGWNRPGTEFWADAIASVKQKYPNVQFLAEVYWGLNSKLQSLGFDYTYDKDLYDKLTSDNLDDLRAYIGGVGIDYLTHSAHFVENHDQDRAVDNFGTPQRAVAAALISMTLPGMRFNFEGQWQGKRNRLVVQLRRSKSEPVDDYVQNFYNTFIPIVADPVFHTGTWSFLPVTNSSQAYDLFAWKWADVTTGSKRLVIVNYTASQGSGAVRVTDAKPDQPGNDTVTFVDLLSGQKYQRSATVVQTTGLFVIIGPYYAQIFQY